MWLFLALSIAAPIRPFASAFGCLIGGGRTHVLIPRVREEATDDELVCQVEIGGLPRYDRRSLVGELRIPVRGRKVRTVASRTFERPDDLPGRARLEDVIVPHATWLSGVEWRTPRRPLLRLILHVYTKDRGRWRLIVSTELQLDDRPKRRR